jgi:hypothetical protein
MANPAAAIAASDVEKKLRAVLGHDAVTVKPYGRHFLIQMDDNGEPPRANNVETEILHSSQLWWAWKECGCRWSSI